MSTKSTGNIIKVYYVGLCRP